MYPQGHSAPFGERANGRIYVLGLRMTEGICEQEFQKQFGRLLPEIYGTILEKYENMGFLSERPGSGGLPEPAFT